MSGQPVAWGIPLVRKCGENMNTVAARMTVAGGG